MTHSAALDEATLQKLVGTKFFFYHPTRTWELVSLLSFRRDPRAGLLSNIRLASDGERIESVIRHDTYYAHMQGTESATPDNLLVLPELHHSVILNVLRLRHQQDTIYTNIGDLVIALNPFKYTIPWYQDTEMDTYSAHLAQAAVPLSAETRMGPYDAYLRPHTWTVAHRAYVQMLGTAAKNHSIVISGESGAGKTETCKHLLRYLVHIAARKIREDHRDLVADGSSSPYSPMSNASITFASLTDEALDKMDAHAALVSARVQQANPILEAFGNAKTSRNDNSSRFGKFMEVQFDECGALQGMRITPFLLEKSRVIHAGADERLFHCFYQLVQGAGPDLRSQLRIKSIRDFKALDVGGCITVRGTDDARDFAALTKAMTEIGMPEVEQNACWRILAAIMHLQNVEFEEHRMTSHAQLSDASKALCVFIAADLLQMPHPALLAECLISNISYVRQDRIAKALRVQQARDQRDSMCKHLYAKLFAWLVERINAATVANVQTSAWIGLLDIFGFEDMPTNSFEQLCINLTNETLQRHYTRAVFDRDVEEMRCEGVSADAVRYRDNAPCIELLQGARNSVLSFLDDASTLDLERSQTNPNVMFLDRLTAQHRPDFQTAPQKGTKSVLDREEGAATPSDFFARGRLDDDSFSIRHYAGDVKYKVAGFVEKNIDTLKESAALALSESVDEVVKAVLGTDEDTVGLLAGRAASSPRSGGGPAVRSTAAANFRRSLAMLRDMLDASQVHWVRCLRPHPRKQPGLFDGHSMLEQLVATGVLETVAQRQRNFPFRMPHAEFLSRFAVVAFVSLRRGARLSSGERCNIVLVKAGTTAAADAQVGHTRVFVGPDARRKLEDRRREALASFVSTLCRYAEAYLAKQQACWLLNTLHATRMQRLVRRKLRIRRAVAAYYKQIHQRILEQQAADRRDLYVTETKSRTILSGKEYVKREELAAEFRRHLLPLIAAVLVNVQVVEGRLRITIENEHRDAMRAVEAAAVAGVVAAAQKEARRIEREALERHEARLFLSTAFEDGAGVITADEAAARAALLGHILPLKQRLNADAADIAEQLRARDRELAELVRLRDAEVERLRLVRQRRTAAEEDLWRRHAGHRHDEDAAFLLSRGGMSPAQYKEHMDVFFGSGAPQAVVAGPVASPVAGSRAKGIGAVTSYRDYAAYWAERFDAARPANGYATPSQRTHAKCDLNASDSDFDEMVLCGEVTGATARRERHVTSPNGPVPTRTNAQSRDNMGDVYGRARPARRPRHASGDDFFDAAGDAETFEDSVSEAMDNAGYGQRRPRRHLPDVSAFCGPWVMSSQAAARQGAQPTSAAAPRSGDFFYQRLSGHRRVTPPAHIFDPPHGGDAPPVVTRTHVHPSCTL